MPKIIIEYTDNIDEDKLQLSKMIDEIHTTFGACDDMAPERILIFCHKVSYYSITTRAPNNGAIFFTLSYLAGRPENTQMAYAKACVNTAQKYVDAMKGNINITVKAYREEIELKNLVLPD